MKITSAKQILEDAGLKEEFENIKTVASIESIKNIQ